MEGLGCVNAKGIPATGSRKEIEIISFIRDSTL